MKNFKGSDYFITIFLIFYLIYNIKIKEYKYEIRKYFKQT